MLKMGERLTPMLTHEMVEPRASLLEEQWAKQTFAITVTNYKKNGIFMTFLIKI